MGFLLTAGVVAFQIAILVTIIGAATKGRGPLIATTIGWVAFTCLGSILTMGLLLFQLFTIYCAYSIGSFFSRDMSFTAPKNVQITAPLPVPSSNPSDLYWISGVVGLIVIAAFFYVPANDKPAPTASVPVKAPQLTTAAPKPQQDRRPDRSAASRSGATSSGSKANSDLRRCLSLLSDDAISRCANQ